MKLKRFTLVLVLLVLIASLVATVCAFMFRKSDTLKNLLIPGVADCEVHEQMDGNQKTRIEIKNTGNVASYIRVRLVFHWEDSKGNVVARDASAMTKETPPIIYNQYSQSNKSGWIYAGDFTFYYPNVVQPGELTTNLLYAPYTASAVTEKHDEVVYTYYPVMEVVAEAIQSSPADAVTESWGATIDSSGAITAITP